MKEERLYSNDEAFTLIELLAIIVILAIIAVITVPIILNVIDESKKGTAINSAYGYRDAIQKFYMSKILANDNYIIENGQHDVLYYVNEGLTVSGEVPSDGWIMIDNQSVTDFSIKIGDYVVTYIFSDNRVNAVKNGDIALTSVMVQAMQNAKDRVSSYIASVEIASNTKNYDVNKSFTVDEMVTELGVGNAIEFDGDSWVYFSYDSDAQTGSNMSVTNYSFKVTEGDFIFIVERNIEGNPYISEKTIITPKVPVISGEVLNNIVSYFGNDIDRTIYFDPVNGIMNCDNYVLNNSKPGFNGIVIGNHSSKTEDDQTSCLKWYKFSINADGTINMILDHNSELGKPYYSSSNRNSYGPVDLMDYLTLDEWKGVPTRNDKYVSSILTNSSANAVDYTGKKARLITAQEVAEITGATLKTSLNWDETKSSSSWFYFDSKNQSTTADSINPSAYYWLFENLNGCEDKGCINEFSNVEVTGNGNNGYWTSSPLACDSNNAWRVFRDGNLDFSGYTSSTNRGVRPVITVLMP